MGSSRSTCRCLTVTDALITAAHDDATATINGLLITLSYDAVVTYDDAAAHDDVATNDGLVAYDDAVATCYDGSPCRNG